MGKYGRCLGEITIDTKGKVENLNELLIAEGHAVAYLVEKDKDEKIKLDKLLETG